MYWIEVQRASRAVSWKSSAEFFRPNRRERNNREARVVSAQDAQITLAANFPAALSLSPDDLLEDFAALRSDGVGAAAVRFAKEHGGRASIVTKSDLRLTGARDGQIGLREEPRFFGTHRRARSVLLQIK